MRPWQLLVRAAVLLCPLVLRNDAFWHRGPSVTGLLRASAGDGRDQFHRSVVQKTQDALCLPPGPERSLLLRRALNFALKTRDPFALTIYSNYMLPTQTKLKTKEYHALLNLCSSPELVDMGKKIFNDMVDSGHSPQEPSFIFLVRACAQMGNPTEAFGVVHRMAMRNVTIRLRTYKPILDELQATGDWESFRRVWDHMEDESGVDATDEQLRQALDMYARAPRLWAGESLAWLQTKLSRFSSEELCLEQATLRTLEASIRSANAVLDAAGEPLQSERRGKIAFFQMQPKESRCTSCGATIPRRTLNATQRADLAQGLFEIARAQGQDAGVQDLCFFQAWLEKHTTPEKGGPFRVIIDAANVAYTRPLLHLPEDSGRTAEDAVDDVPANSSAAGSSNSSALVFKFEQIEQVVQWCKDAKLRPLVVLSMKYSKETFTTGVLRRGGPSSRKSRLAKTQQKQRLSKKDAQLLKKWEDEDILFRVNQGGNDDWYWILACVSQNDQDPLFISNDQLRDHRLRLLHKNAFARWQANAQIGFCFVSTGKSPSSDLHIYEPPVWSREIHWDGCRAWHIPSTSSQWSCVRMPLIEGKMTTEEEASL